MQVKSTIVLFSYPLTFQREEINNPFSKLPWQEIDALSMSFQEDMVENILQIPNIEIHIYRDKVEFSSDFLKRFDKYVRIFDTQGKSLISCIPVAINEAFQVPNNNVILFFENNPIFKKELYYSIVNALSHEYECVIIGSTRNAQIVFLAMRSNYSNIFDFEKETNNDIFNEILRRLCSAETMILWTPVDYSIQTTKGIMRLREEIIEKSASKSYFLNQSLACFKSLEKRYKMSFAK